ncbi:isopenicillin N synthase family dioxygenase [Chondromyces crocatus]|uniref:2-oxoglutarate-dependent ethylene/succinate-forming enzyme n=1 Tax=Chondromyces crocatus TaxID=52 RepID=A0A0K1EKF7_CHOCO|nr:2OG-Fe(II) oxygenase family protein [Chondromyces crocatus]AKT41351.1 uncharacterized protein CMC5_055500 [Chondromyces crocatus]
MTIRTIPMFDYAEILGRTLAPETLLETLRAYGYFYLSGLDAAVPPRLFKSLKENAETFFASPMGAKLEYYIGHSSNHRGYVPTSEKGAYSDETARVYEAFDIGHDVAWPGARDGRDYRLIGPNRYPTHVPGMAETLEAYYAANFRIGTQILRLIARGSRLAEDHFDRYTTRPASQLRMIHYLPNDVVVGADDVSMGAHTDYELFTIIHQASPGLAAFDRKTQTWGAMPVFKNTLLVLAGDMLEFLTGGVVRALLHRVVSTGEERYSFPFFMNLDFETEVSILPVYGKSEQRVVVGQHLLGRLCRDFPYLRARIDEGRWRIDFDLQGQEFQIPGQERRAQS